MLRFWSYRIIRVSLCVSYNRFAVNNESGCQRQRPRIVSIVFGQINAELQIDFSQIFRKRMNQPEFFSQRISRIT